MQSQEADYAGTYLKNSFLSLPSVNNMGLHKCRWITLQQRWTAGLLITVLEEQWVLQGVEIWLSNSLYERCISSCWRISLSQTNCYEDIVRDRQIWIDTNSGKNCYAPMCLINNGFQLMMLLPFPPFWRSQWELSGPSTAGKNNDIHYFPVRAVVYYCWRDTRRCESALDYYSPRQQNNGNNLPGFSAVEGVLFVCAWKRERLWIFKCNPKAQITFFVRYVTW